MSDGNFNRQLLPKNELSAGLRAGKAQMRTRAEQAFLQLIKEEFSSFSDDEVARLHDKFMQLIRS
ncbi:MAG: hypothetical protein K5778_08220 [Bacteroidaceae bacterium]|nr:hypothetical protein [Bacteroidaceae bacterium]